MTIPARSNPPCGKSRFVSGGWEKIPRAYGRAGLKAKCNLSIAERTLVFEGGFKYCCKSEFDFVARK
jgi:hypothetical protein